MAIQVGVSGTTVKKVVVVGSSTTVKKVVIGTPVRRVVAPSNHIDTTGGVSTTGAVTGSVLIYNDTSSEWEANILLEEQTINGGNF